VAFRATNRTDLAVHAGTMTLGAPPITDLALDGHRQVSSSSYYHEVHAAN
jgi:hypothetical protein